jgi:hypothetical protein
VETEGTENPILTGPAGGGPACSSRNPVETVSCQHASYAPHIFWSFFLDPQTRTSTPHFRGIMAFLGVLKRSCPDFRHTPMPVLFYTKSWITSACKQVSSFFEMIALLPQSSAFGCIACVLLRWPGQGLYEPSAPCPEFTLFPKKCQKELSDMSPELRGARRSHNHRKRGVIQS